MKARHGVGLGLVVAVILTSFILRYGTTPGGPAADFRLPDLDGREISLTQFRGKFLVLHFWATWCGRCRHEMPGLESFYQQMADRNVTVLAVSEDGGDDGPVLVRRFRERVPFSFPVVIDARGEVAESYGAGGVPESFLISPDGVILERFVGDQDWLAPQFREEIERLLTLAPTNKG